MQRRCKDWTDDPSHAQARKLEQAFQKLEDDVQVQKNIHTIRDHLKRIESLCSSISNEAMSHDHSNDLEDWAQQGLRKIR
jgi:glycyl-tRNA synthetase beta subunit